MFRFYLTTLSSVVSSSSSLTVVLSELATLSHTQFLSMLQSSVTAHLARLEGGGDLSASPATASLLGLLRDVMSGNILSSHWLN